MASKPNCSTFGYAPLSCSLSLSLRGRLTLLLFTHEIVYMSVHTLQQTDGPTQARVLEIGDLPASEVRRYARERGDVYFERRGSRTFLVADR
jgi:hypothetical protein